MVELNILVVEGKIRTLVVFAARPWITLYISILDNHFNSVGDQKASRIQ